MAGLDWPPGSATLYRERERERERHGLNGHRLRYSKYRDVQDLRMWGSKILTYLGLDGPKMHEDSIRNRRKLVSARHCTRMKSSKIY